MLKIKAKSYGFSELEKTHLISLNSDGVRSCIYCGDYFGDSPITYYDEQSKEYYQIPYCTRKCQIEDPEANKIILQVIEQCNTLKNDHLKQKEEKQRKQQKEKAERDQMKRLNEVLEENRKTKEANKLSFKHAVLWVVFFMILFYLYDKFLK